MKWEGRCNSTCNKRDVEEVPVGAVVEEVPVMLFCRLTVLMHTVSTHGKTNCYSSTAPQDD